MNDGLLSSEDLKQGIKNGLKKGVESGVETAVKGLVSSFPSDKLSQASGNETYLNSDEVATVLRLFKKYFNLEDLKCLGFPSIKEKEYRHLFFGNLVNMMLTFNQIMK